MRDALGSLGKAGSENNGAQLEKYYLHLDLKQLFGLSVSTGSRTTNYD